MCEAYHWAVRRVLLVVTLLLTAAGCNKGPKDRIAYVSMRSDPPGVHVSFADGSQPVRVSSSRVWIAAPPVWAPDGSKLAYTIETGPDQWAIETYDVKTGASAKAITGMKLEDWSPDGAWLIAATLVDPDAILDAKRRKLQQLYAVAADGSGRKVKLSDGAGYDYSPAVSPDGSKVAFASNRNDKVELRVVPIAGGAAKKLVTVRGDDALGAPTWSPDGQSLTFECRRGGPGAIQRICRVSAEGGDAPDVTATWAASPTWSPDGKRLAFVAKDLEDKEQVFVMNADGTGVMAVTSEGRNTLPAWSPDGTRLAFVSDAEGNPDVMTVSASGGSASNVSSNPSRDGFPSWQPRVIAAK